MFNDSDFTEVNGDDGDGICAVFVGQHGLDLETLKLAAVAHMRDNYDEPVEVQSAGEERWRIVPRAGEGSRFVRGQGRGSFPVTQVSFREWSR